MLSLLVLCVRWNALDPPATGGVLWFLSGVHLEAQRGILGCLGPAWLSAALFPFVPMDEIQSH